MPLTGAFVLRSGETYLSVNWLEYFRLQSVDHCVERVRQAFANKGFNVRPNGRFVVIRVGTAKAAVKVAIGKPGRVHHHPLQDDQSHARLTGYSSSDLAVAAELRNAVGIFDSYEAVSD